MPRGVKKTLADKLYDLARTVTVDEFVTAVAETFAIGLKSKSPSNLHNVTGEVTVRAQMILQELLEVEAAQKPAARRKPKSLPAVTAATARKKPGPKPGVKRQPAKRMSVRQAMVIARKTGKK